MEDERILHSWKEIADYLGCTTRTCIRWEKQLNLPVRRVGGQKSKGRVFAYKNELDRWRAGIPEKEREGLTQPVPVPSPKPQSLLHKSLPYILPGLAFIALAALILYGKFRPPRNPHDFRIEDSQLVILDDKGAEIWRYDTGLPNLNPESYYRRRFQSRKLFDSWERYLPRLVLKDINDDGLAEVLLGVATQDDSNPGQVICFNHAGRRLWTFEASRRITYGDRPFSADYRIEAVDVIDGPEGGGKKVLIIARHKPRFPTYVALLCPRGTLKGEYWNSGRISDYVLVDLDGNRRKELVLVGTNNEYGKGCLVVLDPWRLSGGSPQTKGCEYWSPDLAAGSEKFYVLFPRTVVDRIEYVNREVMGYIEVLSDSRLMVIAESSRLVYELGRDMRLEDVIVADIFREKYRKYQDEGKIKPGTLDEAALREEETRGVLYWDGEHWTNVATGNTRNSQLWSSARSKRLATRSLAPDSWR